MLPTINIGGFELHGYSLGLAGVVLAVAYAVLVWRARLREVLPARHLVNIVLITCLAGEVGCRLLGALVTAPGAVWPTDASELPAFLLHLFSTRVYYGTPLAVVAALWAYDRYYHLPHTNTFALAMPALALFHVVGRVGCWFAGCCYGVPTDLGLVAADGMVRFPVQLVESACNLGLFAVLYLVAWHSRRRDLVAPLYFIGYGIARFALEFVRGDAVRGFALGLSTSQWFALVTVAVSVGYVIVHQWRSAKEGRRPWTTDSSTK